MTWQWLKQWWSSSPPLPRHRRPCRPCRPWTGVNSLTEREVLSLLKRGPMTRLQLANSLKITSLPQLLPFMAQRGLVLVDKQRKPYVYQLSPMGRLRACDAEGARLTTSVEALTPAKESEA